MMKSYTAYCMNEDGENLCMTREYAAKAQFISDLHGNGYKVHFVALTDNYDEESAKYYERLETKRRRAAIRRECEREWKRRAAEFEKAVAEAVAEEEPTTEEPTTEETAVNQEVETMNETTTATAAAVKAATTSILSIWYGNLEAYNNGALRGQWIDFEEMDRDEIKEVMNKISRNGRDECMIFDYESRCGIDVGEYASIEELFEIYEICENIIDKYGDKCGEYAIKTFCEFYGAKYLTDIEHYDFYFYSECYSMSDVAFEVVDQCGYLDEMPENLRGYFDYEKFGRDLDIEGHFYYCGNGTYCEMVG